MITPGDSHSFEIHSTTKFINIKFNDIYIHSAVFGTENIKRLEFILQHANHQPGCILRNRTDKLLVKPMIEAIIREYVNRNLYSKEIITQLINTIIIVVARNIAMFLPEQVNECSEEKSLGILQYIQTYIYQSEKIKTKAISQHFGISENYLGRYFKKHTNETMQQYILNYKLKLVENRLLHSEMRISEIVAELGFTDESHLNKLFKKYEVAAPQISERIMQYSPNNKLYKFQTPYSSDMPDIFSFFTFSFCCSLYCRGGMPYLFENSL